MSKPSADTTERLPRLMAQALERQNRRLERIERKVDRMLDQTVADLCICMNREADAPSRGGHWPMRSSKGMSGAPTSASDV